VSEGESCPLLLRQSGCRLRALTDYLAAQTKAAIGETSHPLRQSDFGELDGSGALGPVEAYANPELSSD
jgi:hypothetical protein